MVPGLHKWLWTLWVLCPHTGSACRMEQSDSLPDRGSLHAAHSHPAVPPGIAVSILTAGWALCSLGLVWSWVTASTDPSQDWLRLLSHPWKQLGRHCQAAGINKSGKQDGDFVPKGMNVVSLKPSLREEQQEFGIGAMSSILSTPAIRPPRSAR